MYTNYSNLPKMKKKIRKLWQTKDVLMLLLAMRVQTTPL